MLRLLLPGIKSEHHEAESLQVAKHLVGKQRGDDTDCFFMGIPPSSRPGLDSHLILLQAHRAGGQEALVAVLDGERQVLVKHLQVPLCTHVQVSNQHHETFLLIRLHSPLSLHVHIPSGRELPQAAGAACR